MQGMQEIKERWPPATQVRLVHDVGRMGTVASGNPRGRNGRWLIPVQFSDRREFIPEDQLEPLPEGRMDPLTLLGSGRLISPRDMRRTLLHVRLTGRLADIIYSMEATNTDFYAYQFKPVLKLLQAATKGLLIADEVGLGKTIEAGLIWTELRSRFNLRKLVVLCPAALREKWRDELTSKMGAIPEHLRREGDPENLERRPGPRAGIRHHREHGRLASAEGLGRKREQRHLRPPGGVSS